MSKILKQGETYDTNSESTVDEELNGPEKDVSTSSNDKIKYITIIGVGVSIVLVLLVAVLMKGLNTEDTTTAEDSVEYEDNPATALLYGEDAFEEGTVEEPIVESESVNNLDESLDYYYTAEADVLIGSTLDLRKRGYTADEIEFARENGILYEDLIARADADIKEHQEAVLAELSDQGSEAYQTLLNMTWLQGADLNITDVTVDEYGNVNAYSETKTMNIDYIKVPPKGTQLYLKCSCLDYGVAFMTVTPERWLQLADTGNILVTITIEYWNDIPIITDIIEIDAGDREDYYSTLGGTTDAYYDEVQP